MMAEQTVQWQLKPLKKGLSGRNMKMGRKDVTRWR
jgi:hypothetical protein